MIITFPKRIFLVVILIFSVTHANALNFKFLTSEITNPSDCEIVPAYVTSGADLNQTVQIKGKLPASSTEVPIMHAYMPINNASGEFSLKVDITGLRNTDALEGLMLRTSEAAGFNYCFFGLNKDGR